MTSPSPLAGEGGARAEGVGPADRRLSIVLAWCFTVVVAGLAAGLSIEHPEYLSLSPIVLGLVVSTLFVGLPLAVGLFAVQAPAFEKSLRKGGSVRKAWIASITANGVYAATLTPILIGVSLLLGNEITVAIALRAAIVLVACSGVTSIIWLTFNAVLSKG